MLCPRLPHAEVLQAGVKVYQYTKGMMHFKIVLVDDDWASVGTANLDNRSLHLNFEVTCLIYSPVLVAELEDAFRKNLGEKFARRWNPIAAACFVSPNRANFSLFT